MSWLVHRWLLLYGIALFVIKDCQGLFLRHTQSGKCITRSENLVYNDPNHALSYFVVMTDNCLDVKAQFRYLDSELLHNIEKDGTLISPDQPTVYKSRWAVFKAVSSTAKQYQRSAENRLKQTDAESLSLYNMSVCAEPSTTYVMRKTYCDRANQKFTFGAVTNYGTKLENAHCSPKQHMVVKSANYGDFTKNGIFNDVKNTATKCNALTNCQVKYLCGGKRSCELTIDNKLLSSPDCSNTSKQIYIKYTCVDSNSSTIITTAPNIRLSGWPNRGYVQIKDGSTWRYVKEENWDLSREKMLCQHLGFHETAAHSVSNGWFGSPTEIASGDLMCYKEQPSGTSCCVHLESSTTTRNVRITFARCKICDRDNPILHNSNAIFSGSGSKNYDRAQFYNTYGIGWCASGSTPYLTLDLQKEYHITRIVTMGNKDQTKWIESYSVKYSHDETLVDGSTEMQITGNRNGYQASTTNVNMYNVRHIKIQSTGSSNFCLRIELCGEVSSSLPSNVAFTYRSKNQLTIFWRAPPGNPSVSELIGYQICYSDTAKSSNPSCFSRNARSSSAVIKDLRPATKYFVTVAAGTRARYGTKSAEISKITNGERVNPTQMSYSSLSLIITKPAQYIKNVMVIVATENRKIVEDIETNELKAYEAKTKDPYITAYLKADVLPLTFVIGDGKEYNSETENYVNQPLKQNSSYIVFLRFFENQDSYYSTGWSESVKTLLKPPAPISLKIRSTGSKTYNISWSPPSLPHRQTILKYYAKYCESRGTHMTLNISKEMRSVTVDVEFDKQYTFEIQIGTEAGRSDATTKSWFSYSAPLKLPKKTDDGYTVILKKPKDEQNIKTVALVMLQLQSKSSEPARLENLQQPLPDYPPSDTKADNVAFIAKEFAIDDFQSDKIEISLGEFKEDRRIKRETFKVNKLAPYATYRTAQRNTDGANKHFWSYWSEPFTFTKVGCENSEQSNCAEKIRMALLIPLVVSILCFLLLLGAIVYQRRLIQINIKQPCHKCEASENGERTEEFDSPSGNETTEDPETAPRSLYMNDDAAYESPEYVIGISTKDESATYTSLKEEKEPDNFYQSLQTPRHEC